MLQLHPSGKKAHSIDETDRKQCDILKAQIWMHCGSAGKICFPQC